jgi:hypothetical protein
LDRATSRARQRLTRATELLALGDLDWADYELVRDALETELHQAQPLARQDRDVSPAVTLATATTRAKALQSDLLGGDVGLQREALAEVIERVVPHRLRYARYRLEIDWTPLARRMRALPRRISHSAGRYADELR